MQKLFIAGAGGFAREIAWQLDDNVNSEPSKSEYQFDIQGLVIGEKTATTQMAKNKFPVLGNDTWAMAHLNKQFVFLCAIGNPGVRRKVAEAYLSAGFKAAVFRHFSAQIAGPHTLGKGSMLCMGSSLTGDLIIGEQVIININCTIGHDCVIENYSTLSPGVHLSGKVHIEENVELGTGAVVLPRIRIGKGAIIGAGAVVREDVPPGEIWVGVPARAISSVK